MFQSAIVNGSKYCGPTSLSALTGAGTKEIAKAIRIMTGETTIKGLHTGDALRFLRKFGVESKPVPAGRSLRAWADEWASKSAVHLLETATHFMVVSGKQIVCTQFKGQIANLADSRHLRKVIRFAWEITGAFNTKEFVEYIRPNQDELDARKARRKLMAMADEYGFEAKYERSIDTVWVYWDDDTIEEVFGGIDPFDDSHNFCDWAEALLRVNETLEEIAVPA